MKLRIRGNTLRLRVSKSELEQISTHGFVEDAISFAPASRLVYRLEVAADGPFAAELTPDRIRVRVPEAAVRRWERDDQVSMPAEQAVGSGVVLAILVEKDFECVNPRAGEDSDLFANPDKGAG